MPSVIAVGVSVLVLLPDDTRSRITSVGGAATFIVTVLGLSLISAYAGRPVYQFLEGYTMPRWLARPLRRGSQRRWLRLNLLVKHGNARVRADAIESLKMYPSRLEWIMPTKLGNALRGLETYGYARFGLNSQTFWYELRSAASDKIRESTEEARSAVDFFLSSIIHLILLLLAGVGAAIFLPNRSVAGLGVAVASAILLPCAYFQAVKNVIEWRYSVQALVNTSRGALAKSLGFELPSTLRAEARLWKELDDYVHFGDRETLGRIDSLQHRLPPSNPGADPA